MTSIDKLSELLNNKSFIENDPIKHANQFYTTALSLLSQKLPRTEIFNIREKICSFPIDLKNKNDLQEIAKKIHQLFFVSTESNFFETFGRIRSGQEQILTISDKDKLLKISDKGELLTISDERFYFCSPVSQRNTNKFYKFLIGLLDYIIKALSSLKNQLKFKTFPPCKFPENGIGFSSSDQ